MMRALTFLFEKNMKYSYIDESIDMKNFVVGGILTNNESDLLSVYNQAKKQVLNTPISNYYLK